MQRRQHGSKLTALVMAEDRCPVRPDGIHDGHHVRGAVLERRQPSRRKPVRHSSAAPIHRNEPSPLRDSLKERDRLRTLPQQLDVRDEALDVDEVDRTLPSHAVRDGNVPVEGVLGTRRNRHIGNDTDVPEGESFAR
jgi:hypothetical protein